MKWDKVLKSEKDGLPLLYIKTLLSFGGRSIRLHKIIYPDPWEQFHTHPGRAIRIILWGGYVEEMLDGTMRTWKPGMIGLVRHDDCHRINRLLHEMPRASYSLWLRGKARHETMLKGTGWPVEWRNRPGLGAVNNEG